MKRNRRIHEHARKYVRNGLRVVPIPAREKGPRISKWQELRISESDIPDQFNKHSNIGILLGKPSRRLVDVDLDCEQAIFLAAEFLPSTHRTHGRKSKPGSHYWYRVDHSPKPEKFCDLDGMCLVELRSTGQQTVVPPSVHPSGERLHWERNGKAGKVPVAELLSAVKKLAAAALLARHRPSMGSGNAAAMFGISKGRDIRIRLGIS